MQSQTDSRYTAKQKGKGRARSEENHGSEQDSNISENPPPVKKKRGRAKKEPVANLSFLPPQPQPLSTNIKHEEVQDEIKSEEVVAEGNAVKGPREKRNTKPKDIFKWYIEEKNSTNSKLGTYGREEPSKADEGYPSEIRPRQWCSSRAELMLLHPELSKKSSANGIAWEGTPFPVILLEGRHGISISSFKSEGEAPTNDSQTAMDVTINRTFECTIKDLPGGIFSSNAPSFFPTVDLPPNENIIPNGNASTVASKIESTETCQILEAQNEGGGKGDQKTAADSYAEEPPIKFEALDVSLLLMEGPLTEQNRGKRKKGQKPSRRSIRLKLSNSGDSSTLADAERHVADVMIQNTLGNDGSVESQVQSGLAREFNISSYATDVPERIRIPPPHDNSGAFVFSVPKSRDTSQGTSQPRDTRPKPRIDTQCNSINLSMLSESPLTPLSSPAHEVLHPVSAPLRRSVRISSTKVDQIGQITVPLRRDTKNSGFECEQVPTREVEPSSDSLRRSSRRKDDVAYFPQSKKRKEGRSPEPSRSKKQRKEKESGKAVTSGRARAPEPNVSISLRTDRKGKPKREPSLKLPNRLRKLEESLKSEQLESPTIPRYPLESISPSLSQARGSPLMPEDISQQSLTPFPARKYTGLKFNKRKTLDTTPIANEGGGSFFHEVQPSSTPLRASSTGPFQDVPSLLPDSTLATTVVPEEQAINADAPVEHRFPLHGQLSSEHSLASPHTSSSSAQHLSFADLRSPVAPKNETSPGLASANPSQVPSIDTVSLNSLPEANQSLQSAESTPLLPLTLTADAIPVLANTSNNPYDDGVAMPVFPSPIPPEIQAVIDAYNNDKLILGIASREIFNENACVRVAEEYRYFYTGFWRVKGVEVATVALEKLSATKNGFFDEGIDCKVRGRVQWSFDLQWVPGQEGLDETTASYPWWRRVPDGDPPRPTIRDSSVSPSLIYPSLLISDIQADRKKGEDSWSAGDGDGGSARGWYCSDCGKLNRQIYWRRRKCGSTLCRDKLMTTCSARTLDHVQDRGQQQPLVLPTNTHPDFIDPLIIHWEDEIKTLIYKTGPGRGINHVFTGNIRRLQEEQTMLFEKIQEEVVLQRGPEDSRPYFSYGAAHVPSAFTLAAAFSAPVENWNKVRPCITQTRDMLAHIARYYGELSCGSDCTEITSLLLLAWTVDGRKKADAPLSAKQQSIVLMTLGHETAIYLLPKSGVGQVGVELLTATHVPPPDLGFVCSAPAENPAPSEVKLEPSERAMEIDCSGLLPFPNEESEPAEKKEFDVTPFGGTSTVECPSPSNLREERHKREDQRKGNGLKFTLVHGDALILSGDDFEYTIEREGISILLMGVLAKR